MRSRLKKGEKSSYYIDIALVLAGFLFVFFCRNSPEITKSYLYALLFMGLALFARFSLGRMRDKNHLRDSADRVVVANCLLYFIITNFCGLVLSFSKSYASLELKTIFSAFVPVALQLFCAEYLRQKLSASYIYNRRPLILYTILVIILNFFVLTDPRIFKDAERSFIYISSVILPMITQELTCAYLSFSYGFSPALIYKAAMTLYPYIFPIVPNLGPYLQSVSQLFLSFSVYVSCSRLKIYYDKDRSRFRRFSIGIFTAPLLVICTVLAILVSGIFDYKIIAIGSNSMAPLYERGDAVIFRKTKAQDVSEGDILVFDDGYKVVTHRVVKIQKKNNQLSFITRGDANNTDDVNPVPEDKVIGTVALYTKYIGFPTLWFNDLLTRK